MDIKYWIYNNGQLCNQLYYALQMFIKGNNNICFIEDCHGSHSIYESMCRLGLKNIISDDINNRNKCTYINSYCQHINQDFSLQHINEFIKKFILNSEVYEQIKNSFNPLDNSIAIHIRNCDYLQKSKNGFHDCFNREIYIKNTIEKISVDFKTMYVFSDDISLSKSLYDGIFVKRFENVIYMDRGKSEDDLIRLSLFKDKILWNSTYSYWSAFISNVIYPHSENNIMVPSKFTSFENASNNCNPLWIKLNV